MTEQPGRPTPRRLETPEEVQRYAEEMAAAAGPEATAEIVQALQRALADVEAEEQADKPKLQLGPDTEGLGLYTLLPSESRYAAANIGVFSGYKPEKADEPGLYVVDLGNEHEELAKPQYLTVALDDTEELIGKIRDAARRGRAHRGY